MKTLMDECPEDKDMCDMVAEELGDALEEEKRLQHLLLKSLLPKDEADERDCILEVRAGNHYFLGWDLKCKFHHQPTLCFVKLNFAANLLHQSFLYTFLFDIIMYNNLIQEQEGKKPLCLQWTYSKCILLHWTTGCCW